MSGALERDLIAGDRITARYPDGRVRAVYVVEGYTPAGKVRLRRPTGTTFTAWWRRWLPRRHEFAAEVIDLAARRGRR